MAWLGQQGFNDITDWRDSIDKANRIRWERIRHAHTCEATLPAWFLYNCYKIVTFYRDQDPALVDHRGELVFQYTDEAGNPYQRGQIICFCSETGYNDVLDTRARSIRGTDEMAVLFDGGKKFRVEISVEEWHALQKVITPFHGEHLGHSYGADGYTEYGIRSHCPACCDAVMACTGDHNRCLQEGSNPWKEYAPVNRPQWP